MNPPANGVAPPSDPRSAALFYRGHGFAPLPLPAQKKRPAIDDWPNYRLTDESLDRHFPSDREANLGLLLGKPSNGLVDVDLDSPESVAAAPILLPPTNMATGRESAPASHWWYLVDDPPTKAADKYTDPTAGLLVELRSTGGQTVVPPSIYPADPANGHPKPERCVWHRHGKPARVTAAELRLKVGMVAAAALLGRHWPTGGRHDAALALAGGLLRAGWAVERVEEFTRAVCAAAKDDEIGNRLEAVRDTAEALAADETATGWPTLARLLGSHGDVLVRQVCDWLSIAPSGPRSVSGPGRSSESSDVGPRPRPKYVPVAPYVPFPTDVLPDPWAEFVRQGAAALRCDEALVALPVLSVLAGSIGNTRRVYLGGEWFEPAVLWTCVVAESGGLKSPAADLSVEIVKARQKTLVREFKDRMADHKRAAAEFKKQGGEGDAPERPILQRVIVGDVTIEKLAGLLDDNRRGVLVHRDELAGWLGSFTKYKGPGGGSDEPNWLSMHRADAIIYDRKTGDKTSVFVPHAAVSVTGGIQPGTLARLMTRNLLESGLAARIVFAMPPRRPKTYVDDGIAEAVKGAARKSLDALFALSSETDDDGDPRPVLVRLTPAARARFRAFVNDWGRRQFQADGERASALSKLEAIPGRFALIHHVTARAAVFGDTDPIDVESVEAGIRLAEWCANEADRVYALLAESAEEKDLRVTVELVRRLADRNGGRVTVQKLQNANGKKYRTSESAEAALDCLASLGLGRWEDGPPPSRGGKRVRAFAPNPTSDDSYDRPDGEGGEGSGGPSDDRPPPPDDFPGTGPASGTQTPGDESSYDESTPADEDRSSESSDVGRGRDAEGVPADAAAVSEPVVGPIVGRDGYTLVTDPAGLARVAATVRGVGVVGLDTETTGLDHRADRVRLLQIAAGAETYLIDLFRFDEPAAALAELFAALAAVEVVGHNLQFDLRFLARLGFTPGAVFCTLIASQVLHAGRRQESGAWLDHDLAAVARRELGREMAKDHQTSDWSKPLTPGQLSYAAADAAVLLPLAAELAKKLSDAGLTETVATEMRALPGLAWAAPVTVDRDAWIALASAAEAEKVRLAEAMDELVPNPATLTASRNWNSPEQVKAAFKTVGVVVESTDDDVLAAVEHPLAGLMRDYRAAAKKSGTYGKKWVHDHAPGGEVAARWNQCGAESGRMSCKSPNLQQIPRGSEYRRCLVARPGHVLVKADYSQIELRIAARIADEPEMIRAYQRGADLHTLTASRILGKPAEDVTKADRQLAKAVNFGLLFGMGWKSLRVYALANYGVQLTEAQARSYREAFFRLYPRLRAWHRRVGGHVEHLFNKTPNGTHQVRTLGGRRRVLPVAKRNAAGESYPNKTEALNTPVQGTGADGLKRAVALLWERRGQCPEAVPVIFCHDEIVLEVPEGEGLRASQWLKTCMVDGMAPLVEPVPVEVEVTVGRTWAGN